MTSSLNRSLIFAPTTRLPFLMTSSHLVLVVITAPYLAAVLAMLIVWRASST